MGEEKQCAVRCWASAGPACWREELGRSGREGAVAGLLGPNAQKGKEKIKFFFYFLKYHFKSNLDSNLSPFANFDQPKHHKNRYASA